MTVDQTSQDEQQAESAPAEPEQAPSPGAEDGGAAEPIAANPDSAAEAAGDQAATGPAAAAPSAAAEDKATRDQVQGVNDQIAKGMEAVGGKPGKYIGKALTYGSKLASRGIEERDKTMGDYDNKTVSDADGNSVPQQKTYASVGADKATAADAAAQRTVGKLTDNATVKNIAGKIAGGASIVGNSIADAPGLMYDGAKGYLKDGMSWLKRKTGVSNP